MMLNIIASYNKLLYAIINTLYKITTTSRINFAILKLKVFQSTENFEILLGGGDHNFVSQSRKICEVNYNFVSVENFVR